MSDDTEFPDLMARVRRSDAQAAEELFRQFEAQVRLEVQMRLRDPRLRRLVDESDVCQSVMLSFFVRARLGEYDVADPQELRRLLAGMARNKVAAQARRHSADRRDFRRAEGLGGADMIAATGASPSQVVAGEELLRELRARLSAEEQRIADLRVAGRSWAEVAEELGGTGDGRRVEFVEGKDLAQFVAEKGAMALRDACECVRQAALALAHAHERGLIHRDVKPSNLLLGRDGAIKLLDLGLARQGGADGDDSTMLTESGAVMGTPDYVAPEQICASHEVILPLFADLPCRRNKLSQIPSRSVTKG